jgi:hypothetical protein
MKSSIRTSGIPSYRRNCAACAYKGNLLISSRTSILIPNHTPSPHFVPKMSTPAPKSSLSLHVKYYIDPQKVPDFLAALRPAYEGVISEPENIFFEVYTSESEPGLIKFVENWNATPEWFMNVSITAFPLRLIWMGRGGEGRGKGL